MGRTEETANKFVERIIPILFYVFLTVTSLVFFAVACLIWACTVLFDRRLVVLHLFSSFWGSLYIWVTPNWSASISGREKMDWRTTYMIVSNHQSQLDIMMAFGLFFPFKWVSKAEVFWIPFVGWNMALNRYIKLKRGDRKSIREMMHACERTLARGSSVFFFPEGTRSETGIVKPFSLGAFILAKKMKVPILPLVINGASNALPKHSLFFRGRHRMRLEVLDPIPYEEFADKPLEEIASRVRDMIAARVDEHSQA